MAIGDQKAGLLFQIKADDSDAVRAFKNVDQHVGRLTGTTGGLTSAFAGMLNPAALASTGIAAIGTAAAATVTGLFRLTQAASEYGSAIFDASQRTGLSAASISALKFAADQSGSSLEAISGSVAKFNALLGDANAGNEKARKTLEQYGITAVNTDEALQQAILTIAEMTEADKQAAAAKALFKDRTGEILPVIKSFDGDLPALIAKLRDLGLVMSDQDAKAADEFGDQMDTLQKQLKGVAYAIGFEVLPVFLDLAREISGWLKSNPGEIQAWGRAFRAVLLGVVAEIKLLALSFEGVFDTFTSFAIAVAIAASGGGLASITTVADQYFARQSDRFNRGLAIFSGLATDVGRQPQLPAAAGAAGRPGGGRGTGDDEEAKREADRRAKERQDIARRDAAAQIGILKNQLDQAKDSYSKALDDLRDAFTKSGDRANFEAGIIGAAKRYGEEAAEIFAGLTDAENRLAIQSKKTASEMELLRQDQQKRVEDFLDNGKREINENSKLIEEVTQRTGKLEEDNRKKALEGWQKGIELRKQIYDITIDQIDHEQKNRDDERKLMQEQLDHLKKANERPGTYTMQTRKVELPGKELLKQSKKWLKDLPLDVLDQFAAGLGSVVEQFVLMGTAGPDAMRKLTASILAGVASQAAILAIKHLAFGIAALTPWGAAEYGPASNQFAAAALFGSIAFGAAVAGRAIAGDSFANGGSKSPEKIREENEATTDQNRRRTENDFRDRGNPFYRAFLLMMDEQKMMLGQVNETMGIVQRKFNAVPPSHIIQAGVKDRSARQALIEASDREYGAGGRTTERTLRKQGLAR